MLVTYAISGRGSKGGVAKSVLIFTVTIKVNDALPLSKKEDLDVFIEGPEELSKINIMGGERGTYHIGFTPNAPGQYWVDFRFKGTFANESFLLPIKDTFNKVPDVTYTGKYRLAGSGDSKAREEEEARSKAEEDAAAARRKAEEEAVARKRAEEEAARRKAEEASRKMAEEEAAKRREEEEIRKSEEEAARRRAEERKRSEEEATRRREEEDRKRSEEEAARRREEEAAARKRAEEEAARKRAEEATIKNSEQVNTPPKKEKEELDRKAMIERKKAEIAEKRRKAEEERRREEELKKKAEEEDMEGNSDLEKEAIERERVEKERLEKERVEEERLERERLEKERLAKERMEKERLEKERLAKERLETERLAKERLETERLEKERLEKKRLEKERLERERLEEKPVQKFSPSVTTKIANLPANEYCGHLMALNFVFSAINKRGEKKAVGGDADLIEVMANREKISLIEDAGDGTYTFDYECVPGENTVSVSVKGKRVKGFPISFRRKTMEEIEEENLRRGEAMYMPEEEMKEEEERLLEEEMKHEMEEETSRRLEEEDRRRFIEEDQKEAKKEAEEDLQLQKEMDKQLFDQEMQVEAQKNISTLDMAGISESEKKLQEIEERKRKIAEKRAEIARKREQHEALAAAADLTTPSKSLRAAVWESRLQQGEQSETKARKPVDMPVEKTASKLSSLWEQRLQGNTEDEKKPTSAPRETPSKGTAAARWLQSAQEDEKKEEPKKKVDMPAGSGASKVASLWQTRLQGNSQEEKKVEKTAVDLGGQGASKVASLWQNRLEGKEPEPQEVKKTTIDIPLGAGASKVASLWQSKLEEKPSEPKIEKGSAPRRAGPSALASQWEQNANQTSSTSSGAKKDIEDLKQLMAKEREQLSTGKLNAPGNEFTEEEEEVDILISFLSNHLKGETLPHKLPLSASNPNLWNQLSDGITLCKFFNKMVPDILDTRVITNKVNDKRDKIDNWNLCVQSARSAGCRLHDVKVELLADGDPISIQKVIFQIAKIGLETDIKMSEEYLLEWLPLMDPDDLAVINIDELLVKWVNAVVSKAGHAHVAKNISKDFRDCFLYVILINEILGMELDLGGNELERAESVMISTQELNKGPLITLNGIVEGVYWQNYFLLSSLLLTAAELK